MAILLVACQPKTTNPDAPPTPEAKAYAAKLKLGGVAMKAADNMAGQTLTEIEGTITNTGDRTVDYAALVCVFYDFSTQVILRERVALIKKPLKPGETRSFRLPFDDIPSSWNNQLPQLVIAQLRLA